MDQHYGLKQTVAPASEPLTVLEVKPWLHINADDGSRDAVLTALIVAARECCERVTERALITQTWELDLDDWPDDDVIRLPRNPVQSVSSVKYLDTSGVLQTLAAAAYRVDTTAEPARIEPAYGYVWPSVREVIGAIQIVFVAGYGAASAVPQNLKERLAAYVSHRHEMDGQAFDQSWLEGLFAGFAVGTM